MADSTSARVLALVPLEMFLLILHGIFTRLCQMFRRIYPASPRSLKGEIILVTGGANGIGRAICQEIAKKERDLSIIIWDVNEKANSEIVTELKAIGLKNVFAHTVDVSQKEQVAVAARTVRKEIGHVSMLFNNAGIPGHGLDGWKEDPEIFKKVFAVNVFSHSWTLREFLPHMIEQGRGHVVATCSALGYFPSMGCAYGASKFAVRGFMEGVKEEVRHLPGKPKIFFTTVFPGLVSTDMSSGMNLQMQRYKFVSNPVTPEYAAQSIIYGVLRGQEHIYVPEIERFSHFLLDNSPPESVRKFYDLAGAPFKVKT